MSPGGATAADAARNCRLVDAYVNVNACEYSRKQWPSIKGCCMNPIELFGEDGMAWDLTAPQADAEAKED